MPRLLLTWSDRGGRWRRHLAATTTAAAAATTAAAAHAAAHDQGPILRLLEHVDQPYDAACVLSVGHGGAPMDELRDDMAARIARLEVMPLEVADPSDHEQLFRVLGPVVDRVHREFAGWDRDILLSAGTPQAQTLWVILVKAGILDARMLKVVPAEFVPVPHPHPVREVRLDIAGFPEIRALRDEVVHLRAAARLARGALVGESEPMAQVRRRVARLAAASVPVLVLGETGTGKELVARAIHDSGPRADRPFIAENCGAFAESVLASELFGHEPGAFTGAARRRRGLFEQAHGGTLFLDEVGELSPRVQATLLRVLQEGTLRRVGGEDTVAVDVRVLAATHQDLEAMVARGRFRDDLYYRLRGATLEVPPLRDRAGDIPLLVERFLADCRARLHIAPPVWRALERYAWPGNVRQLRAEVVRWTVFCDRVVEMQDLADDIAASAAASAERVGSPTALSPSVSPPLSSSVSPPLSSSVSPPLSSLVSPSVPAPAPNVSRADEIRSLADEVEATERAVIQRALERHDGNISHTARALRIDRNTLKRKLRAYGMGRAAD